MFQRIINGLMSIADGLVDTMFSPRWNAILIVVAWSFAMLALNGFVPSLVGAIGVGILVGMASLVVYDPVVSNEPRTNAVEMEKMMVPYDEWPEQCYACDDELGEVRGQLVVHKGEGSDNLKAVGLCESCTRTHSTLLDYSDMFGELYDMKGEPEEI